MEQHLDIPCEEYSGKLPESICESTAIDLNNTIIALNESAEAMCEAASQAYKAGVMQAIMASSIKVTELYAKELTCKSRFTDSFWPASIYYQWRHNRHRRKRIAEERSLINLKRLWKTIPDDVS